MNHDTYSPRTERTTARCRATQLIDGNITNARDEGLGSVQDIVLAPDNRSIAYVVVGFGGFLGLGEKFFAMPWRLLQVAQGATGTKPRLSLAVDQEVMQAAPGFDKSEWPDLADATWSRQVDDFYRAPGVTADGTAIAGRYGAPLVAPHHTSHSGRDPNSEGFHFRRVSQLLGMDVVDGAREPMAKVVDLVLDAERGSIEGVAISFGGVLGMGRHLALVPMSAMTLDRTSGTFVVSCTAAELEAVALPGGEWPRLDSDEWLTRGRRLGTIMPSDSSAAAADA